MQFAAVQDDEFVAVAVGQIDLSGHVEPAPEVAIGVRAVDLPCTVQRDPAAGQHLAALPQQAAHRQRRAAAEVAVQREQAADRGVAAVEAHGATAEQIVTGDLGAAGRVEGGCAAHRAGLHRDCAIAAVGAAQIDQRTAAGARKNAAAGSLQHRQHDVGALVAHLHAVAVAGLHGDVPAALGHDAQPCTVPAAGHQVDASTHAAFAGTQVAGFDQQAAASRQRELASGFAARVAAGGVVELGVADGDRALCAQDDVGGLALFLEFAFIDYGRTERFGVDGAAVEAQAAVVRTVAAAALDHDGQRVEQQRAVATARRRRIGAAAIQQCHLAGHLDLTAVAAVAAAARPDVAVEGAGLVGPHHHLAAVAVQQRIGQQAGATAHPAHLRIAHQRIGALPVAADQHRAAAGIAGRIQRGAAGDGHRIGGDLDVTSLARVGDRWRHGCRGRPGGRDRQFEVGRCRCRRRGCGRGGRQSAGRAQRALDGGVLPGVHVDAAALQAAGVDHRLRLDLHLGRTDFDGAAVAVRGLRGGFRLRGQRDRLGTAQHDAAVRGALRAGGRNLSGLGQHGTEHAGVAALGDQLPQIDRFAAGLDAHAQRGLMRIGNLDALAGGQHDVAVLGGDQPGVLDIGGDQQQRAAGGLQRTFVADLACRAFGFELQPSGVEVLVLDVQRGRHQTGGVDLGAGAEQHAVRIDQEYATVGDQVAEDLRRVLADHAVEHGRGRARLDEAGGFARLDGELLPVDDGLVAGRDVERAALLLNADLALHDLVAGRVGDRESGQRCGHGCHQAAQCAAPLPLAARAGFLRHRHVAAALVGIHQSVTPLVHVSLKFFEAGPSIRARVSARGWGRPCSRKIQRIARASMRAAATVKRVNSTLPPLYGTASVSEIHTEACVHAVASGVVSACSVN